MEKIIDDHLVGFGSVNDMYDIENFADDDMFTDGGLSELRSNRLLTTKAGDELCRKLSGEVRIIK